MIVKEESDSQSEEEDSTVTEIFSKESDSQGILGKGMQSFEAEENGEESEGSLYMSRKARKSLQKKLSIIRDQKFRETVNSIEEVIEESANEDEDEESKDEKRDNEEEGPQSEVSSEDRDSDYLSDEEEKEEIDGFDELPPPLAPQKAASNKYSLKNDNLDVFKDMSKKAAESVGLQRNTYGKAPKKFTARGSAVTITSMALMVDEPVNSPRKRRRSSFKKREEVFFEDDFNVDDIHVMGENDVLDKMKEYVDREFNKARKGISRLRVKRFWKKVRGKQLNEEQEKNRLRQKFIYENLDPEQREMFEKELLEIDFKEEDDSAPKFEIVPKVAGRNQGTCR